SPVSPRAPCRIDARTRGSRSSQGVVMPDANPGPLDLPAEFLEHNEADPTWLRGLPELVDSLAARWGLTLGQPFPAVRMNYVVPAWRENGTPCVFKVSRYVDETR